MENNSYKILIVDDDQFLLDIYGTKFKQEGLIVSTATSGEEALNQLRLDSNFDAVLVDVLMPSMDGITLLKNIRENNLAQNAVIVVLSNQGQQSDIDKAKQYNVDGYIVKASTIPSEVLKEVTSIIKKKKVTNP